MKWIFFGDSLTSCADLAPGERWVETVRQSLGSASLVLNKGEPGQNTRQALERFQNDVLLEQPSHLYIHFGANDCVHWDSMKGQALVYPQSFRCNLLEMIAKARAFSINRLFLGTTHPLRRPKLEMNGKSHAENCRDYNAIIREVSKEACVALVDHEQHPGFSNAEALLVDGIHLSRVGSQYYAQTFLEALRRDKNL